MNIVSDIDQLVKTMKENVKKIHDMMEFWKKPLYDRNMKTSLPEDVVIKHSALVMPRLEDIKNNGKEIHRLMKDTADNVKPNKKDRTWLNYVDYVNSLVVEGITEAINSSLNYLVKQISIADNLKEGKSPIFDIKVNLQNRVVTFDPTIESNDR